MGSIVLPESGYEGQRIVDHVTGEEWICTKAGATATWKLVGLPSPDGVGDAGKVPAVNQAGTSYELTTLSGASGLTFQYIEWTHADDGVLKSVALPALTQVIAGWTVTSEAFDGIGGAVLDLGNDNSATAYATGSDVSGIDQVYTVVDLSHAGPNTGFPFGQDSYTIFPAGGHLKGTVTVPDSATGKVRFYFLAMIPTAATLV